MIFKRIGSICFAIGFILAIFVFTNYGAGIIPKYYAKIGMMVLGGIALMMNLLALRYDPQSDNNFIFWIGTVGIFCGLIMKIMHWPFNQVFLLGGIAIVSLSYIYNPLSRKDTTQEDELLDQ